MMGGMDDKKWKKKKPTVVIDGLSQLQEATMIRTNLEAQIDEIRRQLKSLSTTFHDRLVRLESLNIPKNMASLGQRLADVEYSVGIEPKFHDLDVIESSRLGNELVTQGPFAAGGEIVPGVRMATEVNALRKELMALRANQTPARTTAKDNGAIRRAARRVAVDEASVALEKWMRSKPLTEETIQGALEAVRSIRPRGVVPQDPN